MENSENNGISKEVEAVIQQRLTQAEKEYGVRVIYATPKTGMWLST